MEIEEKMNIANLLQIFFFVVLTLMFLNQRKMLKEALETQTMDELVKSPKSWLVVSETFFGFMSYPACFTPVYIVSLYKEHLTNWWMACIVVIIGAVVETGFKVVSKIMNFDDATLFKQTDTEEEIARKHIQKKIAIVGLFVMSLVSSYLVYRMQSLWIALIVMPIVALLFQILIAGERIKSVIEYKIHEKRVRKSLGKFFVISNYFINDRIASIRGVLKDTGVSLTYKGRTADTWYVNKELRIPLARTKWRLKIPLGKIYFTLYSRDVRIVYYITGKKIMKMIAEKMSEWGDNVNIK